MNGQKHTRASFFMLAILLIATSATAEFWYRDLDDDGYGDPFIWIESPVFVPGYVLDGTDCDDYDDTVHPGAPELADGLDNDCDGMLYGWEMDQDGDGYIPASIDPGGWDGDPAVIGGDDCDDSDATVHPGATELADGQDNDCDGWLPVDEMDMDGDGYVPATIDADGWDGDPAILGGEDCNDADDTVHPGAQELADGQDNDCDGFTYAWEMDQDGDGYIPAPIDPGGWDGDPAILGGEDCDDYEDTVYPGAPELLDGMDNDCDGDIDEDFGTAGFDAAVPVRAGLHPNHPNPFNPSTTLSFGVPADGHVELRIYDLTGRLVRTLVSGPVTAGEHEAVWQGSDDRGRAVASGVYLCRLSGPGVAEARRVTLAK